MFEDGDCPRCGKEILETEYQSVDVRISEENDEVRTSLDCPHCDGDLWIVMNTSLPENIGVDMRLEKREDSPPSPSGT